MNDQYTRQQLKAHTLGVMYGSTRVSDMWSKNSRVHRPQNAPYIVKERTDGERALAAGAYRYGIYGRDGLPTILFTSIAQAQHVCEHINTNMAKEVMK